ncbi:hypothetical protein BJ912DRAFT_905969 [Pholiota molesta]|nr:hypothetical protein BJ912DRAFT_905969 [Pholiota molesta]
MFKRVEKRRRKKEEEEELGLDEDMKEILGMHDTDSEESASDSDNSDGSDNEDEELGDNQGELEEGGESAAEDGEESDESGGEEDEDPNVTVGQALADPVYVVSVQPEVKACIVCPGKLLKGVKMVQLHRISKACTLLLAHERRLRQFKVLAAEAEPEESAWEILQRSAEEKPKLSLAPSEDATSKRAEKKKARAASLKLRREKRKAKRAKEAEKKKKAGSALVQVPEQEFATTSSPMPNDSSPPKKQRKPKNKKIESDTIEVITSTDSPTQEISTEEVKDMLATIARSISDRTKSARERALATSKGSKGIRTAKRPKKTASTS